MSEDLNRLSRELTNALNDLVSSAGHALLAIVRAAEKVGVDRAVVVEELKKAIAESNVPPSGDRKTKASIPNKLIELLTTQQPR